MPRHLSADLATDRHVEAAGLVRVDGVLPGPNQSALLMGQNDPTDNGLYVVSEGAWQRHPDFATLAQMEEGTTFYVGDGTDNRGSEFYLYSSPVEVDASPVLFGRRSYAAPLGVGPGLAAGASRTEPSVYLPDQELLPDFPVIHGADAIIADSRGLIRDIERGFETEEYVSGLEFSRTEAGDMGCSGGRVWIPHEEEIVDVSGDGAVFSDFTGFVNTMAYAYAAKSFGGTYNIATVETPPAEPYSGTARAHPDTAGYRFIGCGRFDGAQKHIPFSHDAKTGLYRYLGGVGSDVLRVVNGGTATAVQTVDLGPSGRKLVPPGTMHVLLRGVQGGSTSLQISNSEASEANFDIVNPGGDKTVLVDLDALESFTWRNGGSGGSVTLALLGFWLRR